MGRSSPYAVAEIWNGRLLPYPNFADNQPDLFVPDKGFISVQSVVADWNGNLWVLDSAAPDFGISVCCGAKLVKIDLASNSIWNTYTFPNDVVLSTTYLNDVRFDFCAGSAGYAYITDSSTRGSGAIIVLDLFTGKSVRRLNGHPTTSPAADFIPKVEGKAITNLKRNGESSPWLVASDGIALSPDGSTLYYSPLSGRLLYSVPTEALRDTDIPEDMLGGYVPTVVEKVRRMASPATAKALYMPEIMKAAVFVKWRSMERLPHSHMIPVFYGRTALQSGRIDTCILLQNSYKGSRNSIAGRICVKNRMDCFESQSAYCPQHP